MRKGGQAPAPEAVRVDVWLDVACLFATRSRARAACEGGKVDVNGSRAKPHRLLRVGDRLEITTPNGSRTLVVQALAERSIPKARARALYEDVTPSPSPEALEVGRLDRMMKVSSPARPSSRERRELRRWKGRA